MMRFLQMDYTNLFSRVLKVKTYSEFLKKISYV